MRQFGRSYSITIGPPGGLGKVWGSSELVGAPYPTDVRVQFSVKRSIGKSPNQATIKLWNLDAASRQLVESTGAFVTLLAGYGPVPSLIFRGDVSRRGVRVDREGPSRIVTLECGDGELAWREARFDQSFAPGTPNATILAQILVTMGLGIGPGDPLPPLVYGSGASFFGPARLALERVVADTGARFSIQDGLLVILATSASGTLDGAAVLSPATGLIGSPTRAKKGVNAAALLNGQIRPGRFVSLVSEEHSGFYRAAVVTHAGDTHGPEWTTKLEATPA